MSGPILEPWTSRKEARLQYTHRSVNGVESSVLKPGHCHLTMNSAKQGQTEVTEYRETRSVRSSIQMCCCVTRYDLGLSSSAVETLVPPRNSKRGIVLPWFVFQHTVSTSPCPGPVHDRATRSTSSEASWPLCSRS